MCGVWSLRGVAHILVDQQTELRLGLCWGITPASTAPCLKGPTTSDGNQVFKRMRLWGMLYTHAH